MSDVDLLVIGAGCAGLALGRSLCEHGARAPRTLLLDARERYTDDRSWSFWAKPDNPWLGYARARWSAWAMSRRGHDTVVQRPSKRRYACLRAIDYYGQQIRHINASSSVALRHPTHVHGIEHHHDHFHVETDSGRLTALHVIDTRPDESIRPLLWQQFVGEEVRTDAPCFDPGSAGLMLEMDCDQAGFIFTYLLPFGVDHALIESTRFSPRLLDADTLRAETRCATERLTGGERAEVIRQEFGRLPMGHWPHNRSVSTRPTRAGAGAGALRSASGYGFLRMQGWAQACARSLVKRDHPIPHPPEPAWRRAMDRRFLEVIRRNPQLAPALFERMASRLSGDRLARFLGDEARIGDVFSMVFALPKLPFLMPGWTARSQRDAFGA